MSVRCHGRCRVWRPRTPPPGHPTGHLPGTCRACWQLCRRRTEPGRICCDECVWLLCRHRDARVRIALVEDDLAPADVVELMVDDGDALVAAAAERWLTDRVPRPLPVPGAAADGGDAGV